MSLISLFHFYSLLSIFFGALEAPGAPLGALWGLLGRPWELSGRPLGPPGTSFWSSFSLLFLSFLTPPSWGPLFSIINGFVWVKKWFAKPVLSWNGKRAKEPKHEELQAEQEQEEQEAKPEQEEQDQNEQQNKRSKSGQSSENCNRGVSLGASLACFERRVR